ncbi:large ribosomal subunit protein uL11m-like [Miscanthus floridulus]|uniref:large ribosomal subunit protein uL11m-like n=1 Tax=Miscanthus floridulus TaxID=154761 RepID=UPI00345A618A
MATLKDAVVRKPVLATLRLIVPAAGAARPGQPISPALGSYRLNLMAFCKDFNARTQKYKADTPMHVTVTADKDNTFDFVVKSPPVSWFLKKAAGIETASGLAGHRNVSSLTIRHVYEIAKLKQADPFCKHMSLEALCKCIIGTANSMGIVIVKDL